MQRGEEDEKELVEMEEVGEGPFGEGEGVERGRLELRQKKEKKTNTIYGMCSIIPKPRCSGPYKPTTVLVQAIAATDDSLAIPEHTTPEWSRFVTIVKQQHKLDEVSYHKLFDILKQYQKKVNELRAERLARNANPLALVAIAQANQDPYYQTSKSHKSYAPSSKPSILTRSHTTTRYKGKEIAKPITPPSEIASKEYSDPEQAQMDKDMQKNLALIAKYFKKIYKPTNNNLRTFSNLRNKNANIPPRYKNDNQFGQFRNQRTVNVAEARENPKRVKDSTYHKEKMLLCKQIEQGVPLQAKQYDWLEDTDEEIDEQELEAHYRYMAKIQDVPTADTPTNSKPLEQVQNDTGYNVFANDLQHSEQPESISNTCFMETDDSNVIPDSLDMCDDDIQNDQNDVESDDERVALANLIANLKLDVDENKKIQKQLKKENTTLAQELKECKTILAETSKTLGESNSVRNSCLVALQNKQTEFEKYKAFNDRTIDYDKLKCKLNETRGQFAQKDIEIKEGLKTKAYEISVVKEKNDELIKQCLLTKSHYKGLVKQKTKVENKQGKDKIGTKPDQIKKKREAWFVTIVKQQHKLDEVSYHKLFDILKQYQNEVNELRAERLARNANPLALVATAQADHDPYYQTSRSHRSSAPSSKPSIPSRSHISTRHKGKEIAKPITPPSETASKEHSDTEQAQKDKDITSSNSKNKNVDTTLQYKNDDHSGQFGNQRTVNVAGAREKVGSPVVQKSGIQCFNCREFGHFAKECRKPKRVKDFAYHKEKMLMCKQAEQGVSLQAEQYDWLADTDKEVDEQELKAHYSYMAKIQEVPTADSGIDSEPVEQVQNDAGYNVFANGLQHSEQSELLFLRYWIYYLKIRLLLH
nr:hypothetical protein [Tanacetum cinerariifolium]